VPGPAGTTPGGGGGRAAQLAGKLYDGVVIGGGIRIPPKSLLLLEAVDQRRAEGRPLGAFIRVQHGGPERLRPMPRHAG